MNKKDIRLLAVTGAGSGIGRATAVRFGRTGARIIVSDINGRAAAETAAMISAAGGNAFAYTLDVTDPEAYGQFAERVREEHGICDVVINNAGIGVVGEIIDTTEADWNRIVGTNLLGVVHGSRIFAHQMIAAHKPGHIVNVGSAAGFMPTQNLALYATTKAAVKMLSDCLRAELATHQIGVSVICPGVIKTDMFATATHPTIAAGAARRRTQVAVTITDRFHSLGLLAGPDKVAQAIETAVLRNRALTLVRPEAYAVYALRRLAPSVLRALVSRASQTRTLDAGIRLGEMLCR
ncbi:oxidoreductase [Mycobacterium sp. 852002-40037_SCH5390672]|nr:oxidoreductase [Mycobacterium sp. 852002-40037_SCH5390672]